MKAGKPESENDYQKTAVDGLEMYIKEELSEKKITIDHRGWWVFGGLVVTVS